MRRSTNVEVLPGYLDDACDAEQFVESRKEPPKQKEISARLQGICAEKIDQALEKCWSRRKGGFDRGDPCTDP